MKPDWDKLMAEYKDSPTAAVVDVDCTAGGKSLCDANGVQGYPTIKTFPVGDTEGEKYGVKGYPTIKTFTPSDTDGTAYEGGRDLAALRTHASSIGPSCGADNLELCSEEEKKTLEKYMAMSPARRTAKIEKLNNAIKKLEAEHGALMKQLQSSYEASNSALEALKEKYKTPIKMMTAATPKAA